MKMMQGVWVPQLAAVLAIAAVAEAQVCRLSVAGLNRNRRVLGNVNVECADLIHTSPFGNWGVASNFGDKVNGHQFQGWCHDRRVCDNKGSCFDVCGDGWYEWNSCTDHPDTKAPNCTLYNSRDCTEQESPLGVNVMSTKTVDVAVRCPLDTNGDGQFDRGGCADLTTWSPGVNYMSLYELDPLSRDELIQTLYFPATPIPMTCNVLGCAPAGSEWVAPDRFADPNQPQRVFAEMAAVVNFGNFADPNRACPAVPPPFQTVSSASYQAPGAAPESLVTAFGFGLSSESSTAPPQQPLPLELAGTRVRVTDSAGQDRFAPLLYVSPRQVNYQIPAGVANGLGTVRVLAKGEVVATGALQIDRVAPGIFTANSNGQGAPAALVVRVASNGAQTVDFVYTCPRPGVCSPSPILRSNPEERLYLALFGTGVRGRSSLSGVTISAGAVSLPAVYAGPQGQYAGLDQINVELPPSLDGLALVNLLVTVEGRLSNTVQLRFR